MMYRVIWALAASTLAFTGAPQQSDPSARPFRAEVGIYRLQVRLVDADGADLSGITPQELELRVEGEPRRIVDLMEIDATTLEPAHRIAELGGMPEAPGDRLSVSTLSHGNATLPAARRRYMIFIDLSGGRIATLIARAAAREFVEEIAQSGDLIGVTTYSIYGGLHYIVPFTSDRGLVREALGKAAADPSSPGRRGTQLATLQDLIAEESAAFGREGDASRTRLIEQLRRVETNISASSLSDALADMSDALADIQGRKQIVFFSTGFPDAAIGDTDVRLSLIAAAVAARRAEVVFHTFHPEVLGRYSDNDVSRMSSGFPLPNGRVRGPLDDAPPRRSRGMRVTIAPP